MPRVKVILGGQEFECDVTVRSTVTTYCGKLPNPIDDKQSLSFWTAYEESVNGTMLTEVETLEQQRSSELCRVIVDDEEFQGANIDLQVFPSSGMFSFTISK